MAKKKDALVDKAQEVVEQKENQMSEVEAARQAYGIPDTWTDAQVQEWITYADKVTIRTQSGSWVYDPTRPSRPVDTWASSEIEDFVKGFLVGSDTQSNLQDAVVKRYVEKQNLNTTWTTQQIVTYVRTGVAPELTTRGNPLDSKERDIKPSSKWTDSELEDWVDDAIKSSTVASDDVLALEVKYRFNLPDEANTVYEVKAAKLRGLKKTTVKAVPEGITSQQIQNINDDLGLYYERTKPSKIVSDTEAQAAQVGLDRVFSYALTFKGAAFVAAMDVIYDFIKNHLTDVFSDDYAFRFSRFVSGSQKLRQRHINLISAFQIVAGNNPQFIMRQDMLTQFVAYEDDASRLAEYFTGKARQNIS